MSVDAAVDDAASARRRPAATCVPVALDCETMLRSACPQCEGICRPCELGSSLAPTRGEEHVERRHAELQAERAVAIVRIEPVVAGFQREAGGDENGLVAGAADLEEDLALVLELDFLVVEPSRQQHAAVRRRAARRASDLRASGPERSPRVGGLATGGLHVRRTAIIASRPRYSDGICSRARCPTDGRAPASLGRDRARKSHRDAVAQDRRRRARDARAGVPQAGLRRADARARERADDVHPAGRAQVPRRRRGDHRARGRGAAHSVVDVEHQAEALDDTFSLDVFSPIRQDWLDHTDDYLQT